MSARTKDSAVVELVLSEAIRQDSLVHEWANSLGTKIGLYMVFVGFMIAVSADISKMANTEFANAIAGLALFFAILSATPLLFAAFIYRYRKPPRPAQLYEQVLHLEAMLVREGVDERDRITAIKEKLANSFARSIDENFVLNQRIASMIEMASVFLVVSLIALLVLALAISAPIVYHLDLF